MWLSDTLWRCLFVGGWGRFIKSYGLSWLFILMLDILPLSSNHRVAGTCAGMPEWSCLYYPLPHGLVASGGLCYSCLPLSAIYDWDPLIHMVRGVRGPANRGTEIARVGIGCIPRQAWDPFNWGGWVNRRWIMTYKWGFMRPLYVSLIYLETVTHSLATHSSAIPSLPN